MNIYGNQQPREGVLGWSTALREEHWNIGDRELMFVEHDNRLTSKDSFMNRQKWSSHPFSTKLLFAVNEETLICSILKNNENLKV